MQKRKSPRHVKAANARWLAADRRAQEERDDDTPDRPTQEDWRTPIAIDLRPAGGPLITLAPRLGYIAWRRRGASGVVVDCAAIKTLLHRIADDLPSTLGREHWS